MSVIDKCALALTQCWKCAGCNQLENYNFRGDDKCQNFRKADATTLIQRRCGDEEPDSQNINWKPNKYMR